MRFIRLVSTALPLIGALLAQPAASAVYKWVDEAGKTHYGDRIPPQYANRANERLSKSGAGAVKTERPQAPADARPGAQDVEKQQAQAMRELDQQRQDTALLATYANEAEIELARERELKRNQDTIKIATAGLHKSNEAADKAKLGSLLDLGRRETDAIHAKFDAQKLRFRDLTGPTPGAQANNAKR